MRILNKKFAIVLGICTMISASAFSLYSNIYNNIETSSRDYSITLNKSTNKLYAKYKGEDKYGILNIKASSKEDTGSNYIVAKGHWQPISLIYGDCGYEISLCELASMANKLNVTERVGIYITAVNEDTLYNGDGYYVYDTPKIHKIARKLKDTDSLKIVYNTYDYIIDNIEYNDSLAEMIKTGELKLYKPDIDRVIEDKRGICIDQASLMLSLLRQNGVKSRLCTGYTENKQYHAWVEAFVDNQWLAFDTSLKRDYRDEIIKEYEVTRYY